MPNRYGLRDALSPGLIKRQRGLVSVQAARSRPGEGRGLKGPMRRALRRSVCHRSPVKVGKRELGVKWSELEDPDILDKTGEVGHLNRLLLRMSKVE